VVASSALAAHSGPSQNIVEQVPVRGAAFSHRWQTLFGQSMSVFTLAERDFLIGVQIAVLLKRETFNLYRSIKIKGIELVRAENEHVDFLVNCNSIKRGTHSVTLIPLDEGIAFVDEERRRQGKAPRKIKTKRPELGPTGLLKRSRLEEEGEEDGAKLLRVSLSGSDEDLQRRGALLLAGGCALHVADACGTPADEAPLPWHMLLLVARELTQADA